MNNLNLEELDQEKALDICKFFINSEKNLFLFGRRGTGKTDICMQAVKKCGFNLIYINLSVLERVDLNGYPDINNVSNTIQFKLPKYLPPLENNKANSVILFDEIDKAPLELMGPLLEILQFKTINGTPLNIVSCILTGNLLEENVGSYPINKALLDRGAKYILKFEFDKWLNWAKNNNINELITGFLSTNQNLVCGSIIDESYASPSPRSWELASNALSRALDFKFEDINLISTLISGFVGSQVALRFKIWFEYFKKYEHHIENYLDNGSMNIDYNSLSPHDKIIFIIGACYLAKLKSTNGFYALENLCKLINEYNVEEEYQLIGFNNAFTFEFITKNKLYKCKEFFELFNKIMELLGK